MGLPDWNSAKAGSKTRVALWLATEVREGGTFTKAKLRAAFPSVEQIDRRMRDLRSDGWVISTYREDRSLAPDELRLVTIGGQVWEDGYRARSSGITESSRRATLAADGYACRYCGVGAGETYPDDALRSAKLSVARVERPGADAALLTLCDRCHPGAEPTERPEDVLSDLESLGDEELSRLGTWVRRGLRAMSPAEALWARYRRLPWDGRAEVEEYLNRRRSSGRG